VSNGSFHVETMRDSKFGGPLGLFQCESTTCLEQVEARLSKTSKQNAQANLAGFKQLMLGCDAQNTLGFDDLLNSLEQNAVAQSLTEKITAAETAMSAIDEADLETALSADYNSVLAVHTALRAITTVMKTQFVSVLDLELPAALATDND
jgi:hypothetical protein